MAYGKKITKNISNKVIHTMHAILVIVFYMLFQRAAGHGFLCDPPSRNAAWICGFPQDEPKNYDQMAMNAGGTWRMYPNYPNPVPRYYGVCGDYAFEEQKHAAGGIHDRGVRKTYCSGQPIEVKVNITAYHKGSFDFQLCPHYPETEDCFKTFHTHSIEGTASEGGQPSYSIRMSLPEGITCERCVFRWFWTTNNSPGLPPELFINCADIRIQ
ncbi:MAG: lytic polysaccharide monooxygenase [Sulfuricurvum sp.]